jgi:hypothetical protein
MSNLKIAMTIKQQIGNKALFIIGAKNLVAVNNGLAFKIKKNANVNYFVHVSCIMIFIVVKGGEIWKQLN